MADRSVELFTALYQRLSTDAGVLAIVGTTGTTLPARARVFDHMPTQEASFPCVVLGEETAADYGSALYDGQEHTITLHCWSEATSSLEVKRLMAAVRASLHEASLTLSAGDLVNLRCEFKEYMRDPDGFSHHGVMRFRAVTQN